MLPFVVTKKLLGRFALVFSLSAAGFFPASAAPNYFTRTWQVEQGLPQNKVTAVVQTHDGYLWVGTYNGLARFDGVRFTVFNEKNTPELHSRRITSLFVATDGTLWIGTESGDVSQYKDGHFTIVPMRAKWSGGKIYAITADDVGDVWLMNGAGELARTRDGKMLSPPSGKVTNFVSLTRARDGTVWVNREGRVSLLKQGQLLPVDLSEPGSKTYLTYIQGIAASRDGGLWVASSGNIRKWKNGQWVAGQSVAGPRVADLDAAPWGYFPVANFLETFSGVLAGGTSSDGLWLIFPDSTNTPAMHFSRSNGLPSDWVISLCEDREKNLWCGTGAGLVVIRPNNLETISPPDKWNGRAVLSVLPMPDGTLWAGTEGAGLYRLQNGSWTSFGATNYSSNQGLRNNFVWSLAADGAGKVWAGTWGGGLFKQKDDSFDYAPGLTNFLSPTPALLFVGDKLWIGTTEGALLYQNGNVRRFKEIAGQPFGDVRAIARDKSGALWFGTAGGGLVCWQNGNFHRFKQADGLSSDFIECLHFSGDGALWIGTFGGGLDRFKDGRFSVVSSAQGLPNSVIGHIESDGLGYFWMSSFDGILRASEQDLNRCADRKLAEVPFLTYGINDGLPTIECSEGSQSAGGKTADGRLLFPTAKGLVAVDPGGVKINPLPPPVRIEAMLVDGKKFADDNTAGPLKVSPGRHRIEFEYTGLSFVAPEKVQFKYRLEGLETEWTDAGTKRVANYSFLPPGDYIFHVIACNNDGIWNETGASLPFTLLPYFWQTWWFRVLGGLATAALAGGIAWFDTRRRMRRRLEKMERAQAVERERSRIAHDIHDDLGAQLTRITMLSESAREEQADPIQVTDDLNQIYDTARDATRAMDEIVWAVNPKHDTIESFAIYVEKYGFDYLDAVGIRCRLDLPAKLPPHRLTTEVRHNLFLAYKEALHNAVKHAGATEVRIAIAFEAEMLELLVEDNGRGFGLNDGTNKGPREHGRTAGGNGLENMNRRVREIGGKCHIESEPGRGTKVKFQLLLKFEPERS
jgi:signal transduction histidine kinase/ligand-binding sensor domain-containing protein